MPSSDTLCVMTRTHINATRTAIYVRISLDRIGAGLGVARQEKECRDYCTERGWKVVDVYSDNDVSASSGKPRPEWLRLIADIKSGRIDSIVVWHIDRMTRQPRELEDVIELADKYGMQLGTVTGEVDLATPTGRLVARIMGAAARHEAEHKGERQRSQRRQAAVDGKPNKGGTRPFGYSDTKIRAVPKEADAIRDAARRVLAGETLRSISDEWNAKGLRTVRNKLWTGSMIRQMLISARISGRREIGVDGQTLGEIVATDCWDAIIDVKTSDRLRTLLTKEARRSHTNGTQRRHLLSGLLLCGKCGSKLTALDSKAMRAGALYRCPSSSSHSSVKSCGGLSVLMKYADPTVVAMLLAAIESPDLTKRLSERAEIDPSVATQIVRDEQELLDIATDRAEGTITRAEWVTMRANIDERLKDNKAKLARATNTNALTLLDGDDDIEARWARLNLSQKRAVIAEVFSAIKVLPTPTRGTKFTPDRIDATWRF